MPHLSYSAPGKSISVIDTSTVCLALGCDSTYISLFTCLGDSINSVSFSFEDHKNHFCADNHFPFSIQSTPEERWMLMRTYVALYSLCGFLSTLTRRLFLLLPLRAPFQRKLWPGKLIQVEKTCTRFIIVNIFAALLKLIYPNEDHLGRNI